MIDNCLEIDLRQSIQGMKQHLRKEVEQLKVEMQNVWRSLKHPSKKTRLSSSQV